MIDPNLRLDRLEASVRRLRAGVVVLSCALTGVLAMAAAPAKPNDLTVGRLTASTIFLEQEGRKVELTGTGIVLTRGDEKTSLTPSSIDLVNARLRAEVRLTEVSGHISESSKEGMPASASLNVTSAPRQPSSSSVTVVDGKQDQLSLLTTGLFPPPGK